MNSGSKPSRRKPKLPGLGDVDWGRFLSVLSDTGYAGPLCVEVEDRAYEGSLDTRKQALRQSLRLLATRRFGTFWFASLLSNIGLEELAAKSEEEYVTIATALAGDLPRLAELRAGLRQRLLQQRLRQECAQTDGRVDHRVR